MFFSEQKQIHGVGRATEQTAVEEGRHSPSVLRQSVFSNNTPERSSKSNRVVSKEPHTTSSQQKSH